MYHSAAPTVDDHGEPFGVPPDVLWFDDEPISAGRWPLSG
jgi:hypothetical protein